MKKILFFIHDLGQGGAEKVLVNLVNNMNPEKFDITVMAQFGGGVNERFLSPHVKLINCHKKTFRGNSVVMKFFSPEMLYKHYIKEHYDIVVSYLEGPSARIVSGCSDKDTKLVSWIHGEQHTAKNLSSSFRNLKEAEECYSKFDNTVCVSQYVLADFTGILNFKKPCEVLYNTVETEKIAALSNEAVPEFENVGGIKLIAVGTLKKSKGLDRLIRITKRLNDGGYPVSLFILGEGPAEEELTELAREIGISEKTVFLGYKTNPYKYVRRADLFVCASHSEGFSTAATEALIVGTPVCTVEVSGMKEMLGENNEYGVVTENDDEALYNGLSDLVSNPEKLKKYKEAAFERGKTFSTEKTVAAVEKMLLSL